MKKRFRQRGVEIFNLSFLDVVSMGFGAVVLLLVIVKVTDPIMTERMGADLTRTLEQLHEESARLSAQLSVIQETIDSKQDTLEEAMNRLSGVNRERQQLEARLVARRKETEEKQEILTGMETARQELTEEMERLLRSTGRAVDEDAVIGGIPVDSEYIIFIVDTSGSMQEGAWPLVLQKVRHVLDIYPQVKGLQIMSDMGQYMFSQYAGQWIPDTPARRAAIISRMSGWAPFSNSSPVEGIELAIKRFAEPDKKIGIYVFGDDFSFSAIEPVLRRVEQSVSAQTGGRGAVRIHAMGFPVLFDIRGGLNPNSIRFAALMRALAQENRGSFVGLNSRLVQE